ncbi:hypothetical protein [Streptomyces collinus]|uniref:hypothetical protein n=1 Tax=Streptomyces collinus TaxID=42684 RepID=UPI00332B8D1C
MSVWRQLSEPDDVQVDDRQSARSRPGLPHRLRLGTVPVTAHVPYGTRTELDGFTPFFRDQHAAVRERFEVSLAGVHRSAAAAGAAGG